MSSNSYDVIIIGGGASGLMCAAVLNIKYPSLKVLVIEKNNKAGRKLLATGNGRCNFTNLSLNSSCYNTDDPMKLGKMLFAVTPKKVIDFFEKELGVIAAYKGDLVYPITFQSKTVTDSLVASCSKSTFLYETEVTSVVRDGMKLKVNGIYQSDYVVFACGGVSLPDSGSNGSLYPTIKNFAGNDSYEALLPSLVALRTSDKEIKKLAGLRQECNVTLEGHIEKGEILFTDYGVSGICVMQLSGIYNRLVASGKNVSYLSVDLIPSMDEEKKLKVVIELLKRFKDRTPADALSGLIKKPLAELVVARSDNTPEDIARIIGDFRVNLSGSQGFANAQVTSGGLKLKKVTDGLELTDNRGIYVIGEALNVDGICGGYNLHFAWASAMTAAEAIIEEYEEI